MLQGLSWKQWCGKVEVVCLLELVICSVFLRTWKILLESSYIISGCFHSERKLMTLISWNYGGKQEEIRDSQ